MNIIVHSINASANNFRQPFFTIFIIIFFQIEMSILPGRPKSEWRKIDIFLETAAFFLIAVWISASNQARFNRLKLHQQQKDKKNILYILWKWRNSNYIKLIQKYIYETTMENNMGDGEAIKYSKNITKRSLFLVIVKI